MQLVNGFLGFPYSAAFERAYRQALLEGSRYAALLAFGRMADPAIKIVSGEGSASFRDGDMCSVGAIRKALGIGRLLLADDPKFPAPGLAARALGGSHRSWSAIINANDGSAAMPSIAIGLPHSVAFDRAYQQALLEGPQYAALLAFGRMSHPGRRVISSHETVSAGCACSVGAVCLALGIEDCFPQPYEAKFYFGLDFSSWVKIIRANDSMVGRRRQPDDD